MIALAMTACFTSCHHHKEVIEDQTQRGACFYLAIGEELKNNIDFSGGVTFTTPDGKSVTQQLSFEPSDLSGVKGYVCKQSLLGSKSGTYKVKVNAKAKSPVQASADKVDWAFGYSASACASSDGGKSYSSLHLDTSVLTGFGLPKDKLETKVNTVVEDLNREISVSVK